MIFKHNKRNEYGQKQTLWYSYVLDDKMRTTYSWKPVEPILEMRKIGESYHRVLPTTQHYVQFWNLDLLLVPLDSLKRMICIQSGVWVPVKKYFPYLNLLISTLPLSSFQNVLIELLTIIVSVSTNN